MVIAMTHTERQIGLSRLLLASHLRPILAPTRSQQRLQAGLLRRFPLGLQQAQDTEVSRS